MFSSRVSDHFIQFWTNACLHFEPFKLDSFSLLYEYEAFLVTLARQCSPSCYQAMIDILVSTHKMKA